MSLQERLNRFKQQQEKCQTILTDAVSRPSSSNRTSAAPHRAAPSVAVPVAPVKFSSDTERLQHINAIRKSPAGAQIKRVIDLLLQTRQALTPGQINEACYVDVIANKTVFESLKNNHKVSYDGYRFAYKSKHNLKNKKELLEFLRKFPEGITVVDLKDSYPTVMDDLQKLKAEGEVWLLSNMDSQEDTVYPNDPRVGIRVDEDLKQLYRGLELPRDMVDIERDLQKNGMRPATNTARRRAMAQVHGLPPPKAKPKKKRDISKRTKLTNAHLPELFRNLNVPDL
ncbi:transcription initiation factor TFIIE, beta subunit [Wolffia australiana]